MRRTLVGLVATAALLVPAIAASADSTSNASCNNGKGGNGAEWNGHGAAYESKDGSSCGTPTSKPPKKKSDDSCTTDVFGNKVCSGT